MNSDPKWFKMIKDSVYYLDYRTYITMESGLKRLNYLKEKFDKYPKDRPLKIVMDGRNFTYDSEETHLTMSKLGREYFFNNFSNIKIALINDKYESALSDQESWFKNLDEGLNWVN